MNKSCLQDSKEVSGTGKTDFGTECTIHMVRGVSLHYGIKEIMTQAEILFGLRTSYEKEYVKTVYS